LAEYYVADCLLKHLTEGNHTSQQAETFILEDILMKENYGVIRIFVGGLFSRTNPTLKVL
jgi:hypothetical protein